VPGEEFKLMHAEVLEKLQEIMSMATDLNRYNAASGHSLHATLPTPIPHRTADKRR
jgi:hypothetical protein